MTDFEETRAPPAPSLFTSEVAGSLRTEVFGADSIPYLEIIEGHQTIRLSVGIVEVALENKIRVRHGEIEIPADARPV